MSAARRARSADGGYAMAALLVALSVMAIALSVAIPVWQTAVRREREAELVFRGEQYARAVALFQRKYGGAFPPNVDILLKERLLRRQYKDPMTADGEFQLLYAGQPTGQPTGGQAGQTSEGARGGQTAQSGRTTGAGPVTGGRTGGSISGGQGGILGVASKSEADSIRLYNGRGQYNEWTFVAIQVTTQAGAGADSSGQPGRTGGPTPRSGVGLPGMGLPGPPGSGRGGLPLQLPGLPQPGNRGGGTAGPQPAPRGQPPQ